MNILDNELVRKYFGDSSNFFMAFKILHAMQEPIKKGDKFLVSHDLGRTWDESILTGCPADDPLHPYALRLPDRFQKQECVHCFTPGPHYCCKCGAKPPSEPEKRCLCESSPNHCKCACHGHISHAQTSEPEKCRRHKPGPLSVPELEQCTCKPKDETER